jgi:hypothetical protein
VTDAEEYGERPRAVADEARLFEADGLGPGPSPQPPQYLYPRRGPGARPIKIEVERTEDGGSIAFAPVLGIGGAGESVMQAIRDLVSTAHSVWEEFRSTPPDRLHPSAKAQLRQLESFFSDRS